MYPISLARNSAASPSAAAAAHTSSPVTVPAAVASPDRRPPRAELRNTRRLSGPGAMTNSTAAGTNVTTALIILPLWHSSSSR